MPLDVARGYRVRFLFPHAGDRFLLDIDHLGRGAEAFDFVASFRAVALACVTGRVLVA